MKWFVTGGTGLIGGAVLEVLRTAGHEVSALVRSDTAAARVAAAGAKPVRGDLGEPAGWMDAARTADGAVHAAFDGGRGGTDKERTAVAALLDAGRAARRPYGIVYTSGIWILGPTEGADEDAMPRPLPLVEWRLPIERAVLEADGGEVTAAVVRPGVVYGGSSGLIGDHFESARSTGAARIVGDGSNRVPTVHRSDVGALVRLLLEERARGVFHAVEEDVLTLEEIAAAASRAAGAEGRVESTPLEEARQRLGPFADALACDQVVLARRAREVGWRPAHTYRDAVGSVYREWEESR